MEFHLILPILSMKSLKCAISAVHWKCDLMRWKSPILPQIRLLFRKYTDLFDFVILLYVRDGTTQSCMTHQHSKSLHSSLTKFDISVLISPGTWRSFNEIYRTEKDTYVSPHYLSGISYSTLKSIENRVETNNRRFYRSKKGKPMDIDDFKSTFTWPLQWTG